VSGTGRTVAGWVTEHPRQRWGPILLLLGYLLLAPPVLLFGPLAGLLLLARPASVREWFWLAVSVMLTVLWLREGGDLASQFARAAAVLLTGTFIALTLWRPSAAFSRALLATALAGLALAIWMWHLDVSWDAVQHAVESDLWAYNQEVLVRLGGSTETAATQGLFDQMTAMVRTVGRLYPALLFLAGLAGLRLAWAWYQWLAPRPLGPPAPPFRAFRFNDQLVWGWVAGVALSLLPLSGAWSALGINLLLVWSALYAARGLAVVSAGAQQVPAAVIGTISLIALVLFPFVLAGLTLLGLADTWLDFRRRLAPSTT
jgi:hypothetical protein